MTTHSAHASPVGEGLQEGQGTGRTPALPSPHLPLSVLMAVLTLQGVAQRWRERSECQAGSPWQL